MLKSDLINYIKKYHLDGTCQSVKWTVNDKSLKINSMAEDVTLLGTLDANIELESADFGIFDTSALLSMLAALDNEISISFYYERNKPVGLRLSDSVISATFMLADLSIIPIPRERKELPEMDVIVTLKKDLIDRFIKSKKSLNESKVVALIPDSESVDFVINFSQGTATNTITIPFPATVNKQFSVIAFNADYLCNIFSANSVFKEATLAASERGLMVLTFKDEDYISEYLLKSIDLA